MVQPRIIPASLPRPDTVNDLLMSYRGPTIKDIIELVCEEFNVAKIDLLSSRRTLALTIPRQICSFLAKNTTLKSLPEIGRHLGNRDHTTILHGVRKIERLIATDDRYYELVMSLKTRLTIDRANHQFWGS